MIDDVLSYFITFTRVTKKSGLRILYGTYDGNDYGGLRYCKEDDEDLVKWHLANMIIDKELQPCNQGIDFHKSLGRKIEKLNGGVLMLDWECN